MKTASEILKEFKLDWTVEKRPLYFPTLGSDGQRIFQSTDQFGIIRNDNNVCLGACKQTYTPHS